MICCFLFHVLLLGAGFPARNGTVTYTSALTASWPDNIWSLDVGSVLQIIDNLVWCYYICLIVTSYKRTAALAYYVKIGSRNREKCDNKLLRIDQIIKAPFHQRCATFLSYECVSNPPIWSPHFLCLTNYYKLGATRPLRHIGCLYQYWFLVECADKCKASHSHEPARWLVPKWIKMTNALLADMTNA